MNRLVRRHPVVFFYVLAYLYSWVITVPLALQAQGVLAVRLPYWLHYFSAFGPALAAITITRDRRHAKTRTGWVVLGLLSPLVLFAVAQLIGRLFNQPYTGWTALGRLNFLPALGLWAWVLWLVTSGFGEEIGWRGYALPRLQETHSALKASILLGLAWAGWHLPAFFYLPSYTAMGAAVLPGFLVGVLSGAIVLTWLYNNSGGSVLAAVLWHASFNFVTGSPSAVGLPAAIVSSAVIVWAIAVLLLCDHRTLMIRTVHATDVERKGLHPGDNIIEHPVGSLTHAITIQGRREDIWPWLVQMGAGRAGWYSYDLLDNGGHPSAEQIQPAFQQARPGTVFPALPGTTDGFILIKYEPMQWLVLGWPDAKGRPIVTWAFALREVGPAATRLITRAKGSAAYRFHGLPSWLGLPLARIVHFVMQRKQLIGIANRVERRVGFSHASLERAS